MNLFLNTFRKYDIHLQNYFQNYKKYPKEKPLRERMKRYEIDLLHKKDYKNLIKYIDKHGLSEIAISNFVQTGLKLKMYYFVRYITEYTNCDTIYELASLSGDLFFCNRYGTNNIETLPSNPSIILLALIKREKKTILVNNYMPYIKYLIPIAKGYTIYVGNYFYRRYRRNLN